MHAPTDNADEWYISQLRANPSDWHLRCLVTQRLYECGDYSKAALLMSEAPDIPGDEESIIFAATILGVETPLTGIAILKGYQAASASSPAIDELQQHLNDLNVHLLLYHHHTIIYHRDFITNTTTLVVRVNFYEIALHCQNLRRGASV